VQLVVTGEGAQQTKAFHRLTPEVAKIRRSISRCPTAAGRNRLRNELERLVQPSPATPEAAPPTTSAVSELGA